jgi:ABC-type transport system involved in multi-copper enzyme maturation permease subunit
LAPWGAVLALTGAAVGGWVGVPLALAGVFLLLLACVSRKDGFLLFGPIASAELTRAARLGRPWFWRSVYAVVAGLIVFFNLAAVVPADQLFGVPRIPRRQLVNMNEAISYWFAASLFVYVAVLTVQVMAGAVTEEREKKRWDALLTTDLRGREILLGKLFGRLPVLLDPLLAALPVLAVLPLFGGVPPWLAGTTVLACVAVMFGLGGVTLFFSVFAANRGTAIARTFILATLYLLVTSLVVLHQDYPSYYFPQSVGVNSPVVLGDLEYLLAVGNPIFGLTVVEGSPDIASAAPRMAWHFALFQFGVFFLFGLTAIRRLPRATVWGATADTLSGRQRVTAAATHATQSDRKPTDPPPVLKPEKEPVDRPPVGDWPIVWWERYGWLNKGQMSFVRHLFTWRLGLVAVMSFVFFLSVSIFEWAWPSSDLRRNNLVEVAVLPIYIVGMIFLFPAPFRAARCVAREREADTMDGLLMLPLSRAEILFQKWLGICLCDWPGIALLLAWYLPAVLTGHVPVSVAVLFVGGLAASMAILTAFGLYFSVISKTPGQAVFRLVLFLIVLLFAVNAVMSGQPRANERYITAGVIPPAGFAVLLDEQNRPEKWHQPQRHTAGVVFAWACGLAGYGAMGTLAWLLACRRFEGEKAK